MDKTGKRIADLRICDLYRPSELFHDNAARIYQS